MGSRSLQVLIVEDEAMIRMLMAEMLGELGHRVAGEAGRVDQALSLVNSGLAFDVAVLDVNLDGESAEPVAKAIEARGLPFVFATGYGASGLPQPWRGRTFLQKPFAIANLATVLEPFAGV